MQETGRPTEQIEQIHAIMARSTTFVTLSGPSGLSVGILGLGGVWLIYRILGALWLTDEVFAALRDSPGLVRSVTGVLLGTLVAALTLAFLFAWLRARRYHDKLWNIASRRFAVHLGLPLLAGGVMLPALGRYGTFELAFPVMLVFFGLALISAGKYNFSETVIFGLVELVLGLAAAFWVGAGLILWAVGFGIVPAIYGAVMYLKYER